MATLTPIDVTVAGADPSGASASAGGDQFKNDGNVLLRVENTDASPHTVTVADQGSVAPVGATTFDPNVEIAVAAGDVVIAGPFKSNRFNDANGFVQVTYDSETGLEVSALQLS